MTTTRTQRRRQPARGTAPRRPVATRVVEPIDYSRDYAFVRRDLLMILLIGGLLFAGLIVASFVL